MAKTKLTKKKKVIIYNELFGLTLLSFAFLSALSLFLVDSQFMYKDNRTIGLIGEFIVAIYGTLFGAAKIFFPILLFYFAIRVMKKQKAYWDLNSIGATIIYFSLLIIFHFKYVTTKDYLNILKDALNDVGGGIIGALLAIILKIFFGKFGSYFVVSIFIFIGLILLTEKSFSGFMASLGRSIKIFVKNILHSLNNFLFETVEVDETDLVKNTKKSKEKVGIEAKNIPVLVPEKISNDFENLNNIPIFMADDLLNDEQSTEPKPNISISEKKGNSNEIPEIDLEEIEKQPEINTNYILPPLKILKDAAQPKTSRNKKDIEETVHLLEETLDSFGVKLKVTQVSCGPAITRYEAQPAPGIKVSKIVSLADDIALSLAASDVRIEAPIPGKAAVGIEVPNKEVSMVSLKEVIDSQEFKDSKGLSVAFGKDIAGNPIIADLNKMPHLLVAGSTGSGKSVCMNSIIASLLFKHKPDELKFIMIDPKMVELTTYNGIPHLLAPVVTDAKKAANILKWMVTEMENRYSLFAANGVKDIISYNNLLTKNEDNPGKLPYIVILIDELADLMMVAPADVEDAICRLAQMARAAGMHLVVATQRPSVDVITGIIKANIPSRIAFAVSSQIDSRTILDIGGAEKLLGRGDMLFYPVGLSKPTRVQGVFVSDKEIGDLVAFLKKMGEPEYSKEIESITTEEGNSNLQEYEDNLLPEAAKLLIENGQASISMLQRRLRIGYTRAARLMDILEEIGIVGQYEGSKPRNILIDMDEYNRMFGNNVS